MDIYDRITLLLDDNSISAYKLAKETGLSTGLLSQWKSRKQNPSADKIAKIAEYFGVPVDYLLGRPPFNCWEQINNDRDGFLHYFFRCWNKPIETIDSTWGINVECPETTNVTNFIHFIDDAVQSASVSQEGEWDIQLKENIKKELAAYPGYEFSSAEVELIKLFRLVPIEKQSHVLEIIRQNLELAGLM